MSGDLEDYRVQTAGGQPRGIVFTFPSGRVLMRRWIGPYSSADSMYDSMATLEIALKKRKWKLVKAGWR